MSLLPRLRQAAESQAINHGVRVVRSVLAANPFPNGFKTDDLFKLAVKEPIPENFTPVALEPTARQSVPPPHATHPVRSVKFLKKQILPVLEGRHEIKKVQMPKHTIASELASAATKKGKGGAKEEKLAFYWTAVPETERPVRQAPPPPKKVIGREVGVGLDVSHLNKRRQRARVGKITRNVNKMKALFASAAAAQATSTSSSAPSPTPQ